MSNLSVRSEQPLSQWTYLRHAVFHPYEYIVGAGILLLSLVNWSATILIGGFVLNVVVLLTLLRLKPYRQRVDNLFAEQRRKEVEETKIDLVASLNEVHRREYAKLERLVARIRDLDTTGSLSSGLGRLLTSYLRLSRIYQKCEEVLATTNRHVLEETLRSLEALRKVAGDRLKQVVEQRIEIARKRLEVCDQARDNLEILGQQLAAITDLVSLTLQRTIAPIAGVDDQLDLEKAIRDFEETESTVRELDEFLVPIDVDFEVLAEVV